MQFLNTYKFLIIIFVVFACMSYLDYTKIKDLNEQIKTNELKIAFLKAENELYQSKLKSQNDEILKMQVSKEKIEQTKQRVKTEFIKIKGPTNKECETELKFYKGLINEMAN